MVFFRSLEWEKTFPMIPKLKTTAIKLIKKENTYIAKDVSTTWPKISIFTKRDTI
jgi:hypothetical protein